MLFVQSGSDAFKMAISRSSEYARFILLTLIVLVTGCDSTQHKDPERLRFLDSSVPRAAVYGVEYMHQIGVAGGEGPLRYSLDNAPDWLAIEAVDNNLFKGVLLRGVPGVDGPVDFLGESVSSTLSVSDGEQIASLSFQMSVSFVEIGKNDETIEEGTVGETPEEYQDLVDGVPAADSEDDVPALCLVDENDDPLLTEEEIVLIIENQLDPEFWNGERVKVHFWPLEVSRSAEGDIRGTYTLLNSLAEKGQDFRQTISLPGGKTVAVDEGDIRLREEQTRCLIPLFIIDDLVAERDETFRVRVSLNDFGGFEGDVTQSSIITIDDNEPTASFSLTKLSLPRYTACDKSARIPVTVKLDRLPEQTVTAEFKAKFQNEGPELGTDIIVEPSSQEVVFSPGVDEAEIYFRAVCEAPDATLIADEEITLELVSNDTSNASEDDLTLYLNEWEESVTQPMLSGQEFVTAKVDERGNLYVAVQVESDSDKPAHAIIYQYDRLGNGPLREIIIEHPSAQLVLKGFAVERYESGDDEYIDVHVVLETDSVLAAGPLDSDFSFGEIDLYVAKYRLINNVGPSFLLEWERQVGGIRDDFAGGLTISSGREVNLFGTTQSQLLGGEADESADSFVVKLSEDGNLLSAIQRSTGLEEGYDTAHSNGQNLSLSGTIGVPDDPSLTDITLVSFSDELTQRRRFSFGSDALDVPVEMSKLGRGSALGGVTYSKIAALDDHLGGSDIFISYHTNLSEVTALVQTGSSGADMLTSLDTVDEEIYATGWTDGLFTGAAALQGEEDYWLVRYDLVTETIDDTEVNRLEQRWVIQAGSEDSDKGRSILTTPYAKLFNIVERDDGENRSLEITPISMADGLSLLDPCRELPEGCSP